MQTVDARRVGTTAAPRDLDAPARRSGRALGLLRSMRGWLPLPLAGAALVLAAWPSIVGQPAPFTVVDGPLRPVVGSVAVGTDAWQEGVRAGASGEWVTAAGVERHTFNVALPDERQVGFSMVTPREPIVGFAIGALLAIAGAVLLLLRLPAAAALLAIGVGIALVPLQAAVGLPGALPLVGLPAAVAMLAVRIPASRQQRLFDLAGVAVLVTFLGFAVVLSTGTVAISWDLFWITPVVLAALVATSGELLMIATRWNALPDGTPRRALAAALPLAAESRLEGADEERARLAIELHNVVLPQMETSVEAMRREGSDDAATDRLKAVAADLRGVMQRHQTVTLELGGVAEALRAEFEPRGPVAVTFFVRGGSNRPPRRVEMAAYRIGQAAIDNALRHSGADRIEVSISSARDMFELIVRDDGVGLDDVAEDEARRRGRIGLAQMRLRAEAVGATLDLDGRAGQGTAVKFHWAA